MGRTLHETNRGEYVSREFFGDNPPAPAPRNDNPFNVVEAQIAGVIAKHLAVEPVKVIRSALLKKDLGGDDLDIIELTMTLEEDLGIEISDSEAEAIKTVEDLFAVVQVALGHEADAK